ncbi:MAG TPA: imidazole glycerol phosphate synthase subunit HisH [Burkholderiales bacterium]|nr:imidazole glycerol phosphate synthase subunit HisH [Burkholderiales bacterium]
MFVVIDYDMGNLKSMSNGLNALGIKHEVSGDPAVVRRASAIILPGVGAFGDGMRALERRGLVDALKDKVLDERTPYLGVCLGMQFLATKGYEHGEHRGFDWIAGEVTRITPDDAALKVPHMGWNELRIEAGDSPLVRDVAPGTAVYFLHGYHFVPAPDAAGAVVATTDHGGRLVAALQCGHVFGVQFHPEKSQGAGLAILRNFADYAAAHAEKATDTLAARP